MRLEQFSENIRSKTKRLQFCHDAIDQFLELSEVGNCERSSYGAGKPLKEPAHLFVLDGTSLPFFWE